MICWQISYEWKRILRSVIMAENIVSTLSTLRRRNVSSKSKSSIGNLFGAGRRNTISLERERKKRSLRGNTTSILPRGGSGTYNNHNAFKQVNNTLDRLRTSIMRFVSSLSIGNRAGLGLNNRACRWVRKSDICSKNGQ